MLKNKLKVEDLDTVDQNKLFEAAIEMGIASPDSDVFKDTLKALN